MKSKRFLYSASLCFSFLLLLTHLVYSAPGIDGGDEEIELTPSASYPKTGPINIPVILIQFSDEDTTYNTTEIEDVIFDDSTDTSVKDYFEEVSYGELIFEDTDVIGIDTSPNLREHDHYGHIQLGFVNNVRAAELVKEAVEKADADGFDFSPFDNNPADGYVDGVIVVHQGRGAEESGDDNDIWSHTWSLTSAGLEHVTTDDGVTVDTYIIIPETIGDDTGIMTIGVLCHEFGHLLGLPNLYDTTGYSYGIGSWDTMAHGCWNGVPPGSYPAHFCAWCKCFLGWITPEEIEEITTEGRPLTKTTIKAVEDIDTDTKVYQFLANTDGLDWTPYGTGTGEYFLLENRQARGFDEGLPDTGLLIWHIDESIANNTTDLTNPHKLVDLEEADGEDDLDNKVNQGDGGDPYPGTEENTVFNFQSDPNNEFYRDYDDPNEQSSKVRVEDIELSDADILAELFINEDPELSEPILETDEGDTIVGDTSTFFIYSVDYLDNDGDAPELTYLIIDDGSNTDTKSLSLDTGTASDGTYSNIFQHDVGEYTHYFSFDDGQGGVFRLPDSDSYPGPTVLGAEEEEPPADGGEEDGGDTEDESAVQWHCFIATASYGTPMAKEVKVLCLFRDKYLLTSAIGEKFVSFYYKVSPPIANFISKHPLLKKCVRGMLKPVVKISKTLLPT